MAALMWQADDPSVFGFESPGEGVAGQHRHLRHPGQRRAPRDGAAVHRLHAAPGERGEEHQLHRLPDAGPRHRGRLRGAGRAATPSARSRQEDLGKDLYFDNASVDDVRARDAAYTEIKVG